MVINGKKNGYKKRMLLPVSVAAFLLGTIGCGSKEITLTHTGRPVDAATAHAAATVLTDYLGVAANVTARPDSLMWRDVAGGVADASLAAWLPARHGSLLDQPGAQIVRLGPNCEGTGNGIAVSDFLHDKGITTLSELEEKADELDKTIYVLSTTGDLLERTEKVLAGYGLDEHFTAVALSDSALITRIEEAHADEQPIAAALWSPGAIPHRFDLAFLDDPQYLFDQKGAIETIARTGLADDHPKVFSVLDNFRWTPAALDSILTWWQKDDNLSIEDAAAKWVGKNELAISVWLADKEM